MPNRSSSTHLDASSKKKSKNKRNNQLSCYFGGEIYFDKKQHDHQSQNSYQTLFEYFNPE